MGNRLKSQRQKLHSQRREKLMTVLNTLQQRNNYDKNTHSIKAESTTKNEQALKSILSDDIEDIYQMVCEDQNMFQGRRESAMSDNLQINPEGQEKNLFAEKLCCNIDMYCKRIAKQLQTFNQEMKMEKISQKNWNDFCSELGKQNILPQMKNQNQTNMTQKDEKKYSIQTLPLFQNKYSTQSKEQTVNKPLFCTSLVNLDGKDEKQQKPLFDLNFGENKGGCIKKSNEFSFISQDQKYFNDNKSSCIESVIGNNQNMMTESSPQNNIGTVNYRQEQTEDERQLKEDIKKFRIYLRQSDEIFTMFRKVSSEFQSTFLKIYGKKDEKVPREYRKDPQLMEMRIQVDLMFIIGVFEQLIENMMESFSENQFYNKDNYSTTMRQSFMASLEFKTFPIINMLLAFSHKVFERIRFMLKKVNKEQIKKLKANIQQLSKKKSNEIIENKNHQLNNVKIPFHQSIEYYKKAGNVFQKSILSGVMFLQSVIKPSIFNEIEESKQLSSMTKKQQSISLLQNTSFAQPQSLADKSTLQQGLTNKMSLLKNNSLDNHGDFVCEDKSQNTYEKQIPIYPYQNQNQYLESELNLQFSEQESVGTEDLIPIYEYIISQAESQIKDTLFFDLKIFSLIFDNIQEKVFSYSSQIQNVTNFLLAYRSLLQYSDKYPNQLTQTKS